MPSYRQLIYRLGRSGKRLCECVIDTNISSLKFSVQLANILINLLFAIHFIYRLRGHLYAGIPSVGIIHEHLFTVFCECFSLFCKTDRFVRKYNSIWITNTTCEQLRINWALSFTLLPPNFWPVRGPANCQRVKCHCRNWGCSASVRSITSKLF